MTDAPSSPPDQQPETSELESAEMMDEMSDSMEPGMAETSDPALDEAMMAEMMAAEQEACEASPPDEGMMLNEAMPDEETSVADADAAMAAESGVPELALGPDEMDPAALAAHPLANLLPMMRPARFARLKQSIEFEGQQESVVVFEGRVLDGRNRLQACLELGIPVRVRHFQGTTDEALLYVISANQHRRDLSKSQRAAVAMDLTPLMSDSINQKRIERLRETLAAKRAGECLL